MNFESYSIPKKNVESKRMQITQRTSLWGFSQDITKKYIKKLSNIANLFTDIEDFVIIH
jgi:hypothetical protein